MSALASLLLPPLVNILLMLFGIVLWRHQAALGITLMVLGLGSLAALATPLASYHLRQGLSPDMLPVSTPPEGAGAIVILGGGRNVGSAEFGWNDAPINATWRRLAYGAWLHRQSDLPILVSGGRGGDAHGDHQDAEATLMAAALREVFDVPVRWLEDASRSTTENADYSADMLRAQGIEHVVLISQAWHLARAQREFERAGLAVTPAATEFASRPPAGVRALLPSAYHLHQSSRAPFAAAPQRPAAE